MESICDIRAGNVRLFSVNRPLRGQIRQRRQTGIGPESTENRHRDSRSNRPISSNDKDLRFSNKVHDSSQITKNRKPIGSVNSEDSFQMILKI